MYRVAVEFEEDKHDITETWHCNKKNELKRILCDALDLQRDKNGYPIEPDLKKLNDALKPYADKVFIKNEGKRMKKNYKIYLKLMKNLENKAGAKCNTVQCIANEKIDDSNEIFIFNG